MGSKILIYMGLFIGSTVGSLVPSLWHQSVFSGQSWLGSLIGGIVGIWAGFKINQKIIGG